jgi:hypothetical protein
MKVMAFGLRRGVQLLHKTLCAMTVLCQTEMDLVGQVSIYIYMTRSSKIIRGPAKSTVSRLTATPAEKEAREKKLSAAVRVILECIGEDPDREGLVRTPERYAQALMWMTRGYEERLAGVDEACITSIPRLSYCYRCHQRCCFRRRP